MDEIEIVVCEDVVVVEIGEGMVPPVWGSIGGRLGDQADLRDALAVKADSDDVDAALALKANADDVYSKSEVDSALYEKADAADLGALAGKDQADWNGDLCNIPALFPPSAHSHDDRYYTESEIDAALAGKSDVGHNHDLAYAALGHVHDERYYTEAEVDAALLGKADVIVCEASGDVVSVSDGTAGAALGLSVDVEAVQAGSGDPSPENVRPISGWTGVNVRRTGRNLLPSISETQTIRGITYTLNGDGSVSCNGTATAAYACITEKVHLKGGNSYILSGCPSGGSSAGYRLDIRNTPTTIHPDFQVYDYGEGVTISPAADIDIYVGLRFDNGYAADNVTFYPMIRLASDRDGTYEPYVGAMVPVSWQSEAGTVYGGTVDVAAGLLRVTHGAAVFSSCLSLGQSSSASRKAILTAAGFAKSCSSDNMADVDAVSSYLKLVNASYNTSAEENAFSINRNGVISAKIVGMTTKEEYDAYFSANPLQVVFELAVPVVYELSAREVVLLKGLNVVSADCGPVRLVYRADTKLYIDGKFAELQALVLEV